MKNFQWKIPKIIHQTWKDHNPPSDIYNPQWSQSWKDHHPDWEYRFWSDDDLEQLVVQEMPSHLQWFQAVNGVNKADYGRLLLLWTYGGLYADMDYECLRSFNHVWCETLFLSWEENSKNFINTALIGSLPKQKIFMLVMNEMVKYNPAHLMKDVHNTTGPGMFTRVCRERNIPHPVRDSTLFSPLNWRKGEALSLGMTIDQMEKHRKTAIAAGCWAITYWTGNWA